MRLHHIAYVCKNVEAKARLLGDLLGCKSPGKAVIDKEQGVRILFLDLGGGVTLELLEPYGNNSPVQKHLDKGGGLYHLCFEVDELEKALEHIQKDNKAMVVKGPTPAAAIEGGRVAFVVTAEKDLIEFVESKRR
jgi:methylmalonyl-CoA/ethylmalonyl-CoA epimerase